MAHTAGIDPEVASELQTVIEVLAAHQAAAVAERLEDPPRPGFAVAADFAGE